MPEATETMAAACAFWQAGRDGGSSLVRGAARVLTGVPHYFSAPYIQAYEATARRDSVALAHAVTLMSGLEATQHQSATQWAIESAVPDQQFAGRGLSANPGNDDRIERRLDGGIINMPLWGVTLDREVTLKFGSRFLLEIVDPFPAVAAWVHSGIKAAEQELIAGGAYEVVSVDRSEGQTHARLRWTSAVQPRAITD